MSELNERLAALENAIVALATVELGDVAGHDFHGNQWTGSRGADKEQKSVLARAKHWLTHPPDYKPSTPPEDFDLIPLRLENKELADSTGLSEERIAELKDTYAIQKLTNGKYTTEIDIASDTMAGETAADGARAMAEAHSVEAKLVSEHGPGGGWPVYAFDGSEPALLRMLHNYDEGTFP